MKQFLIIGNKNAITYGQFFPFFKTGEVCTGYENIGEFLLPDGTISKNMKGLCRWFSNLYIYKETSLNECKYNPDKYLEYDNYPAINVDRLNELPMDYNGLMGVPITIIDKLSSDGLIHLSHTYSIEQFRKGNDNKDLSVNNKDKYLRVIIKKTDFEIKGIAEPRYIDEQHKRFAGPVMDGSALYYRVIIQKV